MYHRASLSGGNARKRACARGAHDRARWRRGQTRRTMLPCNSMAGSCWSKKASSRRERCRYRPRVRPLRRPCLSAPATSGSIHAPLQCAHAPPPISHKNKKKNGSANPIYASSTPISAGAHRVMGGGDQEAEPTDGKKKNKHTTERDKKTFIVRVGLFACPHGA